MRHLRILAAGVLLTALHVAPAPAQPGPALPPAVGLPAGASRLPFREPVAVGGEAWGPFRRMCMDTRLTYGGRRRPPEKECLAFVEAVPVPDGTRITAEVPGGALRVRFDRGLDGRITAVTPLLPAGSVGLGGREQRSLETILVDNFKTLTVPPRRVAPGDTVILQDYSVAEVAGAEQFTDMPCTADALARYRGRRTLVLRCAYSPAGRNAAVSFAGALQGTALVDLGTGLTLHQHHNIRLEVRRNDGAASETAAGTVTLRLD